VSVVVAVLGVDAEVLHRLRRVLNEEFHVDVAEHRVEDGVLVEALDGGGCRWRRRVSSLDGFSLKTSRSWSPWRSSGSRRAEQVEAGFLVSGADEGGVGLDGFRGWGCWRLRFRGSRAALPFFAEPKKKIVNSLLNFYRNGRRKCDFRNPSGEKGPRASISRKQASEGKLQQTCRKKKTH
jgi:hypothetical protein